MVDFPPLAPSVEWFSIFMKHLTENHNVEESILHSNEIIASTREFGRFLIQNSKGDILTLSMAVEGGARQLRDSRKISSLKLSTHGDWRKNHLGGMEACLGRKPFFCELINLISNVYSDPLISTVKHFNSAIFKAIFPFFIGNLKLEDLSEFYRSSILRQRGKEIASFFQPEISILQPLSDFGRETILGILAFHSD